MFGWLKNSGQKAGAKPPDTQPVEQKPIDPVGLPVSDLLNLLKEGRMHPGELFPLLPSKLPHLLSKGPLEGMAPGLVYKSGEKQYGVAYTDRESAIRFLSTSTGPAVETSALHVLQSFLRAKLDRLLLNPQTDQVALDRPMLASLFREYALHALGEAGGAWTSVKDGSILVVDLGGTRVVPVYLADQDAETAVSRHGGTPAFVEWVRIRARCREVGAEAPFLQMGYPEQIGIPRRQLAKLCGDGWIDPLDRLEDAIGLSGGIANFGAVVEGLAGLDYVWVLTDSEGDVVSPGGMVDLFTSAQHAHAYARQLNGPGLQPAQLPSRPLFRMLANNRLKVGINRGSAQSWVGLADTMPLVAQQLTT